MDKYTREDGFLYPPIEHRWVVDPLTMKPIRKISKTERPDYLYRITSSHEICLFSTDNREEMLEGPVVFLVNLLAYLFGVRLQCHDWWVDGRLPIREKARTHTIHFTKDTAEDFLSHCYQIWKNWPEKEQKLVTNILFIHARAPSYEWDWERFTIEYMVLDGCNRLARLLNLPVSQSKSFVILFLSLMMMTLHVKL